MLGDSLQSILDNIKEKIKNPLDEKTNAPFAGAFIISWIFYNWQLVFSILNFDSKETRLTKIAIVHDYGTNHGWKIILAPLGIAFCSIIFFYFFSILSLGLYTFFNRWFKARILAVSDPGKVVPRSSLIEISKKLNRTTEAYGIIKERSDGSLSEIAVLREELRKAQDQVKLYGEEFNKLKSELQIEIDEKSRISNALIQESDSNRQITEVAEKQRILLAELEPKAQLVNSLIEERTHDLFDMVVENTPKNPKQKLSLLNKSEIVIETQSRNEFLIIVKVIYRIENWEIEISSDNKKGNRFLLGEESNFIFESFDYDIFTDNPLMFKIVSKVSLKNTMGLIVILLNRLQSLK